MKRVDTAATRPRMGSGVTSWTRVWRTKTLSMSAPPRIARATSEAHRSLESPNPTVAAPNTATPANMISPALARIGRTESHSPTTVAPRAGPMRSRPKPCGPTRRTSRAKAGNRADAPPRITAARSREIAPNTTLFFHTYSRPSRTRSRREPAWTAGAVARRMSGRQAAAAR
jgi:hypothetical protein